MNNYTIKSNDCLWDIAQKQYKTTDNEQTKKIVNKLAEINNISDQNLIQAGNTLQLPDSDSIFGTQNVGGEDTLAGDSFTKTTPEDKTGKATGSKGQTTGIYDNLNSWTADVGNAAEMYALQKMGDTVYSSNEEELAAFEKYYNEAINIADQKTGFKYTDKDLTTSEDKLFATQQLAAEHIQKFDADENGMISKEEFINGSLDEYNETYGGNQTIENLDEDTAKSLGAAFNFFDINQDGNIDKAETMAYYTTMDSMDGKIDGEIKFGAVNSMSEKSAQQKTDDDKKSLMKIMGGFYDKLKTFMQPDNPAQNQAAGA